MTPQQFTLWLNNNSKIARERRCRKVVVLEGSVLWVNALLKSIPSFVQRDNEPKKDRWFIYSDDIEIDGNVNKHTYKNKLGSESEYLLFYAQALNIDALAALSGTLLPGGILFVVFPSDAKLNSRVNQSLFNERFKIKLKEAHSISFIREESSTKDLLQPEANNFIADTAPTKLFNFSCKTAEQYQAVQQIIQVVKGHRNRPLVLTADRGRGKSSALAIACAEIIQQSTSFMNIVITSAHRKSLDIFFKQLVICLGHSSLVTETKNIIEHVNGKVQFMPVDEVLNVKPDVNLLLVDEAASIPLYLLDKLIEHYHRMVFSSTIHGYEGAGRSFSIKFIKTLKDNFPASKTFHIHQPIRWAENDPLEAFIFELCLLNAELPELQPTVNLKSQRDYVFSPVSQKELLEDEDLLKQVFAVLVTAHYQTSPSDLTLLLDNENLLIFTLSLHNQTVGVALIINEGKVNKQDVELIKASKRRLKNQFIPQSLLTHCGEETSFNYRYYRVMRIAILPEVHYQGLGSLFLSHIESFAKNNDVDYIGTSFGANRQLLNFWQKKAYKIARVGFTKDKASGEHSVLLIKSIKDTNIDFLKKIESLFYQSFDYLLNDQYKQLPADLVWQILHHCPVEELPVLSDREFKTVLDFQSGLRQYDPCIFTLHKWLQHQMKKSFEKEVEPIISRIFQKHHIDVVCSEYGFTGKKALNHFLMAYVANRNKKL